MAGATSGSPTAAPTAAPVSATYSCGNTFCNPSWACLPCVTAQCGGGNGTVVLMCVKPEPWSTWAYIVAAATLMAVLICMLWCVCACCKRRRVCCWRPRLDPEIKPPITAPQPANFRRAAKPSARAVRAAVDSDDEDEERIEIT